jgi:hypothetical protein
MVQRSLLPHQKPKKDSATKLPYASYLGISIATQIPRFILDKQKNPRVGSGHFFEISAQAMSVMKLPA